jgi:LPS-assembly protein
MTTRRHLFLTTLVLLALGPSQVLANDAVSVINLPHKEMADLLGWQDDKKADSLCRGYYKDPESLNKSAESSPLGVVLRADKTEVFEDENKAVLSGHVQVSHAGYSVFADHADIFRDVDSKQLARLSLAQYVHFWLPGLAIYSDHATVNLQTQDAQLDGVLFRFTQKSDQGALQARGTAAHIKKVGPSRLKMRQASYTTCPPTSEQWQLKGAKLDLNKETGWGSISHARLYIGKVPIFYFPYYMFPLDKRRHSGVLLPSVAYSSDHKMDVRLPFYLNIAANYDMTVTPRYMQHRGWESNMLTRFLTKNQQGEFAIGFIEHDRGFARFKESTPLAYPMNDDNRSYLKDLERAKDSRARVHFTDDLHWGRYWTMKLDYHRISDPYYYRDLGVGDAISSQDQLLSQASLHYNQGGWDGELRIQDTQTLHQIDNPIVYDQYRQLPYFALSKEVPYLHGLQWSFASQWVNFDHKNDFFTKLPVAKGQRSYLSATMTVPYQSAFAYFKPSWQVQGAWYNLTDQAVGTDGSPSRVLHSLWADSGLRYDRSLAVHDRLLIQTLEPRVYYQYTPFKEQGDFPTFDTTWQLSSYDQLFSASRFAGHDRVSDENRVAVGLQTRFLDAKTGAEKVKMALGSGYAFAERRVCLKEDCQDDDTAKDSISPVAGLLSYTIDSSRKLDGTLVWLPERRQVDRSELTFHFARDNQRRLDLSYNHYRPSEANGDGKHMLDAGVMWPLSPRWQGFMGWDYNIEDKYAEKTMLGLKYESCCWAVRVLGSNQLIKATDDTQRHHDKTIYLQFMLKGLGSVGSSSASGLIQTHHPDYQDAFATSTLAPH